MLSIIKVIMVFAAIACAQSNVWIKQSEDQTGTFQGDALFYHPDSDRFVRVLGNGWWSRPLEPFEVQSYSFSDGRWLNFLPHDSLYGSASVNDSLEALAGKWADSTGFSYGNGRTQRDYFGFFNRQGYLRPIEGGIYNQYAWDSDAEKLYCYKARSTPPRMFLFTYDPSARRWDTLTCTHPLALVGGVGYLRWSALCYDPVNREIVLFGGGGVDADSGHLGGTWVMRTADRIWRKLDLAVVPSPRALSPMVYDPSSRCIVLFGGDHLDYLTSDTWIYRCDTRSWERRSPAVCPAPRAGHAMLLLPKSGKIALLGGFGYGTAPGYGYYRELPEVELWTYSVAADEWRAVAAWPVTDSGVPRLVLPQTLVSAADSADNILVRMKRDFQPSKVYRLRCDASARDTAGERTRGVAANTVTRREGGFIPEWYTEGLDAPDTAAVEASLRSLPRDQWTVLDPVKAHTVETFDWGTSRYDSTTDAIMSFNGGHSSYGANQVMQYSPHTGRFSCGYDAEAQLEYVGASGVWFQTPTFSNRPFMPNHSWASYDFCPGLGRLVVLLGQYTYFYDPTRQDWDGYTRTSFSVGAVQGGRAVRAGRTLVAWQGGLICVLDTVTRQWTKALENSRVPRMYTEETAACYDPLKERIVLFSYLGYNAAVARTYFYYPAGNRLDSLSLEKDSVLRALLSSPVHSTSREAVFLPAQGGILFQTVVDTGLQPFFNCATDAWELMRVPYISAMGSNCTGLMYDERRDLVWMYSPGWPRADKMYVLPAAELVSASSRTKLPCARTPELSAFPNPFNPSVLLTLAGMPTEGATLKVFDLSGRLVADLSRKIRAGRVVWEAKGTASGIYFVAAETGTLRLTKRLVYSK